MKLILIAGAKGGCGRTTASVRLAESFAAASIPSAIIDLSAYPTSHWMLQDKRVGLAAARGTSSPLAAKAVVKPFESKAEVLLVDTGRLDDPALEAWAPIADSLLILSRMDAHSISAFPSIWEDIARLRALNPRMGFLGFLPAMVTPESRPLMDAVLRRFPDSFLPQAIPFDRQEALRNQAACFEGQEEIPRDTPAAKAWNAVAVHLASRMGLQPAKAEKPQATDVRGVLGKLWKMAASAIGSRVRVAN